MSQRKYVATSVKTRCKTTATHIPQRIPCHGGIPCHNVDTDIGTHNDIDTGTGTGSCNGTDHRFPQVVVIAVAIVIMIVAVVVVVVVVVVVQRGKTF